MKKGETLSGISKKVGVSVNDLMRLNKLGDANKLKIGQILNVNPEVHFSNNPYTGYNNPNNSEGEFMEPDAPFQIVDDFASGMGPENAIYTYGPTFNQVKNLEVVKFLLSLGYYELMADGKLTPGEVYRNRFDIGDFSGPNFARIIKNSLRDIVLKKPSDNAFIQAENILGSFNLSMRVNAQGNITVAVYDAKTIKSLTDGNLKGLNVARGVPDVLIPGLPPTQFGYWFGTTYQRYIWDLLIIPMPKR